MTVCAKIGHNDKNMRKSLLQQVQVSTEISTLLRFLDILLFSTHFLEIQKIYALLRLDNVNIELQKVYLPHLLRTVTNIIRIFVQ